MNSRNENTNSMQKALIAFNETVQPAIKATMPGYNDLFDKLTEKNTEIGTLNGAQGSSRTGFQVAKTASKEVLVSKAMTIVFAAKAFAIATQNPILENQMKAYVPSLLLRMRDSRTGDYVEEIITKATPIQTDLEPYGITAALLTNANTALAAYRVELSAPRISIMQRAEITARIATLFKETSQILYHLDTLVNVIRETQPEFVGRYFQARTIINYHGSVISLRGVVKDENGNPIKNVEVKTTDGKRITKTSDRGYYEFKNLPSGINTLRFSKVLFNETTTIVGIVKGERIQLDITLENKIGNIDAA